MTQYLSQKALLSLMLVSLPIGFVLSAIYDIARIRRRLIRPRIRALAVLWTSVEDVLFFVLSAIVLMLDFYLINDGQIRLIGLIGLIPGFLLWRVTFGRLIFTLLDRVLRVLSSVGRFLVERIILPPVISVANLLRNVLARIRRRVKDRGQKKYTQKVFQSSIAAASVGFGRERMIFYDEKKGKSADQHRRRGGTVHRTLQHHQSAVPDQQDAGGA